LGLYDDNPRPDLRKAIRLDPAHGAARAALALLFINAVDYDQHELPSGYVGEPTDDLLALVEADAFLTEFVDPPVRADLKAKISNLRAAAEDWIALRDQLEALSWEERSSIWRVRQPGCSSASGHPVYDIKQTSS
jgi:hypothetical protein